MADQFRASPNSSILIIEDSEDDVFFLQRALTRAGIRDPIQILADGRQAIDYIHGTPPYSDRVRYPVPSLIFLDLKLPYHDGFDVLSCLRRQKEFAPVTVVVLTSSPEQRDRCRARELGATRYLVKPPTRAMLLDLWKDLGRPLPPDHDSARVK